MGRSFSKTSGLMRESMHPPLGTWAHARDMNGTKNQPEASVSAGLKAEMDIVEGAILMVAAGHSTRVTLAGLTFGEELLPIADSLAAQRGVQVDRLWSADDAGADLIIEGTELRT